MIGFIKNLFSGILSFFVGLFSGKKSQEKLAAPTAKKRKSNGYFLELDEAADTKPIEAKKPAKEAQAKTPEPVAAAKPAKKEPAKTSAPVTNGQPAKVELVQTAEGVKAELAKPPSSKSAASKNGQNQTETTFAPKYLNASTSANSRRRPGPSMNPFLDMARQVKPSS